MSWRPGSRAEPTYWQDGSSRCGDAGKAAPCQRADRIWISDAAHEAMRDLVRPAGRVLALMLLARDGGSSHSMLPPLGTEASGDALVLLRIDRLVRLDIGVALAVAVGVEHQRGPALRLRGVPQRRGGHEYWQPLSDLHEPLPAGAGRTGPVQAGP